MFRNIVGIDNAVLSANDHFGKQIIQLAQVSVGQLEVSAVGIGWRVSNFNYTAHSRRTHGQDACTCKAVGRTTDVDFVRLNKDFTTTKRGTLLEVNTGRTGDDQTPTTRDGE